MPRIDPRQTIAYRKAGQQVMAYLVDWPIKGESLSAPDNLPWQPEALYPRAIRTVDDVVQKKILILFAGGAAACRIGGQSYQRLNGEALKPIRYLSQAITTDDVEEGIFLAWLKARAANLLFKVKPWAAVESVAQALAERECLTKRQMSQLVVSAFRDEPTKKKMNGARAYRPSDSQRAHGGDTAVRRMNVSDE